MQNGIHGTGFADDCSLLLHRQNIQTAKNLIQRACNELTEWGQEAGLKSNAQKMVVILFTKDTKTKYPTKLIMNEQAVDFSTDTKYLGVTIDSKLTWTKHFDKVAARL